MNYPQPGQTGQWNPNPPPPPSSSAQPQQGNGQWAPPQQQGQHPQQQQQQQQQQQHQPQPPPQQQPHGQPQHQPNGQYPQQRPPNQQIPPITQGNPAQGPTMTTMQPQHPDQYRSLPPPPMYGHPPYHQQPPMQYPPQPAPRQRTAIACRYCRRRKIRCSGFDQSEDGRCTNCQRFSQECVFTPVSAQTQAFVPAHTVWRNQGAVPQQLYGAYGQPLPQGQIVREYAPQQQYGAPNGQYQQGPPPQYGPPQGQQPQQGPPPPTSGQQSPSQQIAGQKRPTDEPHTPTLPPPNPAANAQLPQQQQQRSASGEHPPPQQYVYPDPTGLQPTAPSPASSATSYHSAQPPQPYYSAQGQPPRSPQPGYSYEAQQHAPQQQQQQQQQQTKQERTSASPQNNKSYAPVSYPMPPSDPSLRAPQPGQDGRSSPSNGNQSRQGVRINELVGPSGGNSQQNGGEQHPSQPQAQAQQAN